MANTYKVGGVDSFIIYGKETTYGSAVTPNRVFGLLQSFKPSINNNPIKAYGMSGSTAVSGRQIQQYSGGKYEVGASVEFYPQASSDATHHSWQFLEHVLGTVTGTGPWTYSQTATIPSMTIGANIDNDTTDRNLLYLGMKVNTCTIRGSVGEPISVSLDLVGSSTSSSGTIASRVALQDVDPYTFAGGAISIGTLITANQIIDSFELTYTNNVEVLYGMGSRLGAAGIAKASEISLNFTVKYLDETLYALATSSTMTATTQPTETSSVALTMYSGATRNVAITLNGVIIDNFSADHDLNEALTEGVTCTAKTIGIIET